MKFHVLVAGSMESENQSLKSALAQQGYGVETAQQAQAVFAALDHNPQMDAVILDSSLLGKSPADFLAQLRARAKNFQIILTVSENEKALGEKALSEGAFDYLPKPVNASEVTYAVKSSLRHREPTNGKIIAFPKISAPSELQAQIQSSITSTLKKSLHPEPRLQLVETGKEGMAPSGVGEGYTLLKKRWCDEFEKEYLTHLLDKNEGNVSAAAREARLDRSNLLRLMRRHGIKSTEYRKAMAA